MPLRSAADSLIRRGIALSLSLSLVYTIHHQHRRRRRHHRIVLSREKEAVRLSLSLLAIPISPLGMTDGRTDGEERKADADEMAKKGRIRSL